VTLGRSALFASVAGLGIFCWGLSLRMAGAHVHHGAGVWPLFVMWAAMMVGMMIPVEAPSLLRLATRDAPAYLAGYLAPWIAFSFAAAALQSQVHHVSAGFGAALLIAAGALQLSPWKRACIERCRTQPAGGFLSGLRAGGLSVVSCGLLMLLPLVTGMANPIPMLLITLLCLLERIAPRDWAVSGVAGAGLAGSGLIAILVR
jgi:predicted metal-binding membrane protein